MTEGREVACFPSRTRPGLGGGDPSPLPTQLCSPPGPGSGGPWFHLFRVGALGVPPHTQRSHECMQDIFQLLVSVTPRPELATPSSGNFAIPSHGQGGFRPFFTEL